MINKIRNKANSYYSFFLDDLKNLVSIDSGSKDIEGLKKIVDYLVPSLEKLGCKITLEENSKYGPTLIAQKKGNGKNSLLLLAHMDTVWRKNTTKKRPFYIKGNKAFGPGVTDCRSGMLTQYYTLRILEDLNINNYKEIVLIFNPDEELGSPFSRKIIQKYAEKVDISLIMEAPDSPNEFITSRGGKLSYILEVFGKPAHSGTAFDKGVNAIDELIYKLRKIQDLNFDEININIATLNGGDKTGIIPDYAKSEIEFRIKKNKDIKKIKKVVEEIFDKNDVQGSKINYDSEINFPPFEKSSKADKYIEIMKECGEELNMDLNDKFCGGCSDGNFTSKKVTTIDGLAPYGLLYHTPDEYLDLENIVPRINLITLFIYKICENN
jgi:glutamate carboxypeptidase